MRRRRSELSPAEIETASAHITARVAGILGESARVAVYVAVSGEVDVRAEGLSLPGRLLAWPLADPERRTLSFHASDAAPTRIGTYGIPEPDAGVAVPADAFDAVVVPGLAFDRHGARLGHGAGYYDRFLPELRANALRIGVCFGWQVVDRLPIEDHDVPMTHVVTEHETIITGH